MSRRTSGRQRDFLLCVSSHDISGRTDLQRSRSEVFDNIVRYQYRPYVGLSLIITLVIRNIYVSLSSQSRNVVLSLSHLISVSMDAHILSHYHLSLTM